VCVCARQSRHHTARTHCPTASALLEAAGPPPFAGRSSMASLGMSKTGASSTGALGYATLSKAETMSLAASNPTLHPPLQPPGKRSFLTRDKTAGQFVAENCGSAHKLFCILDVAVKELEDTIRKDEESLKEMDTNLGVFRIEYGRLQRRIEFEEKIVAAMSPDQGLGHAFKQFDNFQTGVKGTYKHLRQRHADAIDILKTEFKYNPCFKKGTGSGDEFSGAYLMLAKDPSKMLRAIER